MTSDYSMPPVPTNATLKKIYPWEDYNITMVTHWLYAQAQKTGFIGDFEDFKLRYGTFISALDPQDIQDLLETYQGSYRITPMINIEQRLKTKNKILNQDIIIDPIPDELVPNYKKYSGHYSVTPIANIDQILRTEERILDENIIVERIPIHTVDNDAGGRTVTIG